SFTAESMLSRTKSPAAPAETVGGPSGGSLKQRRRPNSVLYAVGNFFSGGGSSSSGSSGRKPKCSSAASSVRQPVGRSSQQPGDSSAAGGAAGTSASSTVAVTVTPAAAAADADGLAECPVCAERLPVGQFPDMITDCGHFACRPCLATALRLAILEGLPAACLSCSARLHPEDVNAIVSEELRVKYELFTLRRVLAADPDCRWCPAPDCKYAVIASDCASCPRLECEVCGTSFCYHCKSEWHPTSTCEQARIERQKAELYAAARDNPEVLLAPSSSEPPAEVKQCPRCATYISKENDGSCNHMKCKLCGTEFCWLCRKEITDLHYLSPSGCTFWGKKPWSRKKKILWQVGTLIGAPVGIALLAGLALPVIIAGVPVWAAHRLRHRLRKSGRRTTAQRRCLVALVVTGSIIVSPVVAVLTVAVAVPILLAYVYAVVPVSLCRSDGCASGQDDSDGDGGEAAGDPAADFANLADARAQLATTAASATGETSKEAGFQLRIRADVSPNSMPEDANSASEDAAGKMDDNCAEEAKGAACTSGSEPPPHQLAQPSSPTAQS
ncbi:hypothetical protein BOX15_Mlig033750g1, partial [Macrostomum lignano]